MDDRQRTLSDQIPLIDRDLIEFLEREFLNLRQPPSKTEAELRYEAGQRSVILRLRQLLSTQEERARQRITRTEVSPE